MTLTDGQRQRILARSGRSGGHQHPVRLPPRTLRRVQGALRRRQGQHDELRRPVHRNRALLTAEAIAARGLTLAGWVANCVDPAMPRRAENIAALEQRLGAPLLGTVPHLPGSDPAAAASHLKLPEIRGI